MSFDLDRLRLQAARVTDYVGYETVAGKQFEDMYRKAWLGRSLIGYKPDSRKGMRKLARYEREFQDGNATLVPTDLASAVPYMTGTVHQLDAQNGQVRVMVISSSA